MKSPESFYSECAEKLGIDLKVVKKVNSFFWKVGVKRNLSRATYRAIFLKNIGTITISRYKLRVEIVDMLDKIRRTKINVYFTEATKALIDQNLRANLKVLLERRNEIALENYKPKLNEPFSGIPESPAEGS